MGLGPNVSPVGRKATGQTDPGVEVQDNGDGTKRIKMTESKPNHRPTTSQRAQSAATN